MLEFIKEKRKRMIFKPLFVYSDGTQKKIIVLPVSEFFRVFFSRQMKL